MRYLAVLLAVLLFPILQSYGQGPAKFSTCDCVAFRLDDIQDYYLNQVQLEVIKTFEKRNASLTVGVIGKHIGEDDLVVDFLKERMARGDFVLELANHGWEHEDFTAFDKDTQSELLSTTNEKISGLFGVQPAAFIPPFNRMNNDTLSALAENRMRIVSSSLEIEPPFAKNMTASAGVTIYHFPRTAETGDIRADGTEWLGLTHEQTMVQINQSIAQHGYAVVMMHPQEFAARQGLSFQNAVDTEQLRELELLLDILQEEGYEIVTLSEIAAYSVPEFPSQLVVALATGLGILLARSRLRGFRKDPHLPL